MAYRDISPPVRGFMVIAIFFVLGLGDQDLEEGQTQSNFCGTVGDGEKNQPR